MYLKGEGVTRDPKKAFFWIDMAARHGLPFFQWWLGRMYEAGIGAEQNDREAILWYQQAVVHGFDHLPIEITDLQLRALEMLKDDNGGTGEPANRDVALEDEEGTDDELQQRAQEPITVWVPETHHGGGLPALAVPYNGGKMTYLRFMDLLQGRLEELISADPGSARHWLTSSVEYSPDLYMIATYPPRDWPIQIMMSDQMMIRLNAIDWERDTILTLDRDELPSFAEIVAQL